MHLCFGSFSEILCKNRKNNAVSKEQIGRDLLEFLLPGFTLGKESSYIYRFMNQKRELPKELKSHMSDEVQLEERVRVFVDSRLRKNTTRLREDMTQLIHADDTLDEKTKDDLLRLSESVDLPQALATLFLFIVENTENHHDDDKEKTGVSAVKDLSSQIEATESNVKLARLAKKAVDEQNTEALESCLKKMTNQVYVSKTLVMIAQQEGFLENPMLREIFHRCYAKIGNDRYRCKVLTECLQTGYYKENPRELLERHFHEFTNNVYIYEALMFLFEQGFREEAMVYKDVLSSRLYRKRFEGWVGAEADRV